MTTIATRSAAAMPLAEPDPQQLKRELRAAQTRKRLGALALIAPLAIFLLLTFVAPIVALLQRAIENPEVAATLPQTVAVLSKWDRKSALPDQAFSALAEDLARAKEDTTAGNLARRLNIELSGSRSLVI
jgi:putative spermidine/putrescine transport system permease protein